MFKIGQNIIKVSIFVLFSLVTLNYSNVFSLSNASRETLIFNQDKVIVRLSPVYFVGKNAASTYIPAIANVFDCKEVSIRQPYKEYNSNTIRSSYYIHGNRDYYQLRGNPINQIFNIKREPIANNLEEIEYLGGTNSKGIQNSYGYWWGTDLKDPCNKTSVYSPIYGEQFSDVDQTKWGGYANGGFERNLKGASLHKGFLIKTLHLSAIDKIKSKWYPIFLNDYISNYSSIYKHLHLTIMYGTGNGYIDVPYTKLLVPEIKQSLYYEKGYIDGATLDDNYLKNYLQFGKYDTSKTFNGFEKEKLEATYKYFKTLESKKIIFDLGGDKPFYVNFDANGKIIDGVSSSSSQSQSISTSSSMSSSSISSSTSKSISGVVNTKPVWGATGYYLFLENTKIFSSVKINNTFVKGSYLEAVCKKNYIYYGTKLDNMILLHGNGKNYIGICDDNAKLLF